MSQPFDASAKGLIDADPLAWIHFLGLPGDTVEVADSDLTTTVTSDRLFRVGNPDYLAHTEVQSAYDSEMGHRVLSYNVTAGYKYRLPVESAVILLRPQADGPAMSGRFEFGPVSIRFHVVRIWEHSPEEFLTGPMALLPLALIAKVDVNELPVVIRRVQDRMTEVTTTEERAIWTRCHLLVGLRLSPEIAQRLFEGVFQMHALRESSTYQQILAEGLEKGMEKGMEKGLEKGMEKGLEEGRSKGKEELLGLQLQHRFSTLPEGLTEQLDRLTPTQLDDLGLAMLKFESLTDLDAWLSAR